MKIKTIALATAFALTSTFALAQAGGASGAGSTVPEKSGTAVNGQGGVVGSTTNGTTTGMSNDGMKKDGMSNDGMKKDMSKDGSQSGDTMKKKGM